MALTARQHLSEQDAAFALQQIEGWQKARTKLPTLSQIDGWLWPKRVSMEQCSSEQTALYKVQLLERVFATEDTSSVNKIDANNQGADMLHSARPPRESTVGRTGVERESSDTFPTPSRHLSDTLPTISQHLSDTFPTVSQQSPNNLPIRLIDLTGGFGIDFFYLSQHFTQAHYVERQPELCEIASHNFALAGRANTTVHNTIAETFLDSLDQDASLQISPEHTVCFLDPARRDSNGGKVFRLQDCEPNIIELMQKLTHHADTILLKLSPMLDISEALRSLGGAIEVHVVAIRNEVKEVLILIRKGQTTDNPTISCVNLDSEDEILTYSLLQETELPTPAAASPQQGDTYLYEPNSAVMKAGAYRLLSKRYQVLPLSPNTHIYTSDGLVSNFPGRIFRAHIADKAELSQLKQANIICRNYPLRPEELKKKYKLRDGGTSYLIGAKQAEKATLYLAERIK